MYITLVHYIIFWITFLLQRDLVHSLNYLAFIFESTSSGFYVRLSSHCSFSFPISAHYSHDLGKVSVSSFLRKKIFVSRRNPTGLVSWATKIIWMVGMPVLNWPTSQNTKWTGNSRGRKWATPAEEVLFPSTYDSFSFQVLAFKGQKIYRICCAHHKNVKEQFL